MKRATVLLLGLVLIWLSGCAGCGGGSGALLDHDPTTDELKQALENAFLDVNKNTQLKDAMVERLSSPKLPWAELSQPERERHMNRYVMPVMLTFFQSFDKNSSPGDFDPDNPLHRFRGRDPGFGGGISSVFNCFTCHGEAFPKGPIENFDFSRPTHLYPLDPNNLPTIENPGRSSARMVRFMQYTVTPAMRVLLGRSDVNCFTCHQKK